MLDWNHTVAGIPATDDIVDEGATMSFLSVIASVIIPPVGVFLKRGFGLSFLLNIVLTVLGYVPGLLHALWIVTHDA